ncbi:MAG: peptidylprolyl isomerase [Kiritimatiellaeota bacterium]|nr:peptidylprolyl isomerase [Kiritimatiellota bacterium]
MKILRPSGSSVVCLSLCLAIGLGLSAQARPNPNSTAVTVDGFVITWGSIFSEMQRLQQASTQPVTAQQAADGLVVRHLLSLAADQAKIVVPAQDIATAINNVRQQVPTNTSLEAVLRSNNVSDTEFRTSVITTLRVNRLLQQEVQKVTAATDADIKQFIKDNPTLLTVPENVTARTILVATLPSDDAAARKTKKAKAEGIRKQLLAGADFAKLAASVSDDPTRAHGGQLPSLRRGQVTDKIFENAAFSQKEGEIGPIVETQYGYVILQVQKHVKAGMIKLEDVKEKVRTLVTDHKRQQVVQDFIRGLRAKAKIVYADAKS